MFFNVLNFQDVRQSIVDVQAAGVTVRMVTGDNKITATAIAEECGILREGGVVLEGPVFRYVCFSCCVYRARSHESLYHHHSFSAP